MLTYSWTYIWQHHLNQTLTVETKPSQWKQSLRHVIRTIFGWHPFNWLVSVCSCNLKWLGAWANFCDSEAGKRLSETMACDDAQVAPTSVRELPVASTSRKYPSPSTGIFHSESIFSVADFLLLSLSRWLRFCRIQAIRFESLPLGSTLLLLFFDCRRLWWINFNAILQLAWLQAALPMHRYRLGTHMDLRFWCPLYALR